MPKNIKITITEDDGTVLGIYDLAEMAKQVKQITETPALVDGKGWVDELTDEDARQIAINDIVEGLNEDIYLLTQD